MRALVLAALVAGCGGGGDAGPTTCTPDGYWIWPADCEDAVCGNLICDATCPAGQTCPRLDCTQSPQCRIECQDGTQCEDLDCRGGGDCFFVCLGTGNCTAHGATAGSMNMECLDGSTCLLDCGASPSSACHFSNCTGGSGIVDCGSGVSVCNRPCPAR